MAGGRPLKFQSVKELELKIADYFAKREIDGRPLTITGLAVDLDTDRDTLLNYEKKEEFFGTIKSAKNKIHAWTEEYLFQGKNQAGCIFNLKNNYGWKDKSEVDNTIRLPKPLDEIDAIQENDWIQED